MLYWIWAEGKNLLAVAVSSWALHLPYGSEVRSVGTLGALLRPSLVFQTTGVLRIYFFHCLSSFFFLSFSQTDVYTSHQNPPNSKIKEQNNRVWGPKYNITTTNHTTITVTTNQSPAVEKFNEKWEVELDTGIRTQHSLEVPFWVAFIPSGNYCQIFWKDVFSDAWLFCICKVGLKLHFLSEEITSDKQWGSPLISCL